MPARLPPCRSTVAYGSQRRSRLHWALRSCFGGVGAVLARPLPGDTPSGARARRRVRRARHSPTPGGGRRRDTPPGASRPARARGRGRGGRDRPRLLSGLRPSRSPARALRVAARLGARARQAGRRPHAGGGRGNVAGARGVRRHRRPPLLLVAGALARRARARVLPVVRGERHLPQGSRAPSRGRRRPSRPDPGRDRQPVPRASAGAGTRERARERGLHARGAGGGAGRGSQRARGSDRVERVRRLRASMTRLPVFPNRELGQHFLVDENILGVIGRLAELDRGDVVLEVGPGLGILTRYLADRVRRVHAVELDRALEPHLDAALEGRRNVDVLFGDALRLDLGALRPRPTKLVANLPYNVATPVVVESLDGLPSIERWCVMVQREVADRFLAAPGTKAYGAVSVLVQLVAERAGFHPVARTVFRPPPNVDSALVALSRRGPLPEGYAAVKGLVEAAFAHRRKTLPNSLELAGYADRGRAAAALEQLGFPAATRAERLAPDDFAALAELLS